MVATGGVVDAGDAAGVADSDEGGALFLLLPVQTVDGADDVAVEAGIGVGGGDGVFISAVDAACAAAAEENIPADGAAPKSPLDSTTLASPISAAFSPRHLSAAARSSDLTKASTADETELFAE